MQHLFVFKKKKQLIRYWQNQILKKSSGHKHISPKNQPESQSMIIFLSNLLVGVGEL